MWCHDTTTVRHVEASAGDVVLCERKPPPVHHQRAPPCASSANSSLVSDSRLRLATVLGSAVTHGALPWRSHTPRRVAILSYFSKYSSLFGAKLPPRL